MASRLTKHPDLAKKFRLLYDLRLNPEIRSNADLARKLKISRQGISKWCRGSETDYGNKIPHDQVEPVAGIFGIRTGWFALDMDSFESRVRKLAITPLAINADRPAQISLSLMPVTEGTTVGRESEIDALHAAWRDANINIIQLIGFGGTGKSSCINAWLKEMDATDFSGAEKVYAWSFHWQGAGKNLKSSGDLFIEHALEWFGDTTPSSGTPWGKVNRLVQLIRQSKTLLILDGLEPLQFPPGPKTGFLEDSALAVLLRELSTDNTGLCVITTRLPVADLGGNSTNKLQTINLQNLSVDYSAQLLADMGVRGDEQQVAEAINRFQGHPLSLRMLGNFLRIAHAGQLGEFSAYQSLLADEDQWEATESLMRMYKNWFEGSSDIDVLNLVATIGRSISVEELKAITNFLSCLVSEERFMVIGSQNLMFALNRLCSAGLLSKSGEKEARTIDCHPLVRDYLTKELQMHDPEKYRAIEFSLFAYFQQISPENPQSISDYEPLFRAVIHGARAGRYREAFKLYFERVKNRQFSMFAEGSHHSDQSCLRCFFEQPWVEPVPDLDDAARHYLLSCCATNLIYLGQIDEAIPVSSRCIEWFAENSKWEEALNATGPLASMLIAAGDLDRAMQSIANVDECVALTGNDIIAAMSDTFKAYGAHLAGDTEKAWEIFERSEQVMQQSKPESAVLMPTISSYYCKFLLDNGLLDRALKRSQQTFEWRNSGSWQLAYDTTSIVASDTMVLGLVYLQLGDMSNAEVFLNQQVDLFKSADEWLYLPTGLNSRAQFYIATQQYEKARSDLEEALQICKRTGARFGEWESLLNLSNLALATGDTEQATETLEQALRMPGMSAYRFRDSEIENLKTVLYGKAFEDQGILQH